MCFNNVGGKSSKMCDVCWDTTMTLCNKRLQSLSVMDMRWGLSVWETSSKNGESNKYCMSRFWDWNCDPKIHGPVSWFLSTVACWALIGLTGCLFYVRSEKPLETRRLLIWSTSIQDASGGAAPPTEVSSALESAGQPVVVLGSYQVWTSITGAVLAKESRAPSDTSLNLYHLDLSMIKSHYLHSYFSRIALITHTTILRKIGRGWYWSFKGSKHVLQPLICICALKGPSTSNYWIKAANRHFLMLFNTFLPSLQKILHDHIS